MADFTAPSWLFPKEGPFDNFIKGSQAGAAIAANRIRAQAVYADIRQTQQKLDLAEHEQVTRDEASSLHNEVVRGKLKDDAEDFATLRDWWPKFQANADGEIDPPVLHNENTMMRVSAALMDKRSKIGEAAFAEFMSQPGVDLSKPEWQSKYFAMMAKYRNIPAKLGPDGIMGPIRLAEDLKRRQDLANSMIQGRTDKAATDLIKADNQGRNIDSLVVAREARQAFNDAKLDLEREKAAHDNPLKDARVKEAQTKADMAQREMEVKEGNLKLRGQEVAMKEDKIKASNAWSPADRSEFYQRAANIRSGEADPVKADQQIHKLRQDMEKTQVIKARMAKYSDAKPAAEGKDQINDTYPPMPSRPEDMKEGEIYITPRYGPARWVDGKFEQE